MTRKTRVFQRNVSERYDKYLFIVIFVSGLAWIITTKYLGVDRFVIAGVIVALIVLYTALCFWFRLVQIREDVIGDNVYYLGFLFTLVSLAYALWEISLDDGQETVAKLIANFGVALSSTIAGILIRVLITQFRQDPVEIERDVRLELIEVSSQLKTNLHGTIEQFSTLNVEMAQLLRESTQIALDEQRKTISESGKAFSAELIGIANVIKGSIKEPLTDAAKKLQKQSDALVLELDKGTNRMHDAGKEVTIAIAGIGTQIEKSSAEFTRKLDASANAMSDTTDGLNQRSQQVYSDLERLRFSLESASDSIGDATSRLTNHLDEVRTNWPKPANTAEDTDRVIGKLEQIIQGISKLNISEEELGDLSSQVTSPNFPADIRPSPEQPGGSVEPLGVSRPVRSEPALGVSQPVRPGPRLAGPPESGAAPRSGSTRSPNNSGNTTKPEPKKRGRIARFLGLGNDG